MQRDGAFRAFAHAVNALPANASTPLSVIRSHADATANRWGYTWQLGHPVEPAHLWFLTESTTAQGDTQSSSSAVFGSALASTFTSSTSNGGYGSYNNSTGYSTGLAYVDSTLTGATAIGAILLIALDTTPGKEFFCWALKTHGGNDELHRDSCHALYKSPGTTGWCSIASSPAPPSSSTGRWCCTAIPATPLAACRRRSAPAFTPTATSCAAASPWATTNSRSRTRACSIPHRR